MGITVDPKRDIFYVVCHRGGRNNSVYVILDLKTERKFLVGTRSYGTNATFKECCNVRK